jgi:hypothetical protein
LQRWFFFGDNRPFYRTNLQTDTTVNAGVKIDPVPVGALGIFAGAFMDASNGTGIDAVGYAFTDVGNNGVSHGI